MVEPIIEGSGRRRSTGLNLLPLSLRAVLIGAVGGSGAALLMLSIETLQHWIWGAAMGSGQAIGRPLLWCLALPITIGALLALLGAQTAPGRLPEFGDTLADLHQPPAAGTAGLWGSLRQALAGGLALLGGATIGPEALVTHCVAGLSRWIWRGRDQAVARAELAGRSGFIGLPRLGPIPLTGWPSALLWRWLPGSVAGLVAFEALQGFHAFGLGVNGLRLNTSGPPAPLPVLLAVLSALAGAAIGWVCGHGLWRWRLWLQARRGACCHPLAPVFTGLAVGLALWALPVSAFSGELQLQPLLLGTLTSRAPLLLFSGALKLLLAGLCLETGWRGGLIFPALAGSAAIGVGLHQLLPAFAEVGIWCGSVVGGCLTVVMPSPRVALVLALVLLHGQGAAAVLVGVLISAALSRALAR